MKSSFAGKGCAKGNVAERRNSLAHPKKVISLILIKPQKLQQQKNLETP